MIMNSGRCLRAVRALACVPLVLAAAPAPAGMGSLNMGPPGPAQPCVAGFYDGDGFEIAAGLELRADHRFRYGLSYGAIDEQGSGRWDYGKGGVLLTSDPVIPPRFVLVGEGPGAEGRFHVALDVPEGLSRQFFAVLVRFSDGRASQRQLGEEGLDIDLAAGQRPVSLTLVLPIYDLESETFTLAPGAGGVARFRFDPNDLGRVAFADTRLTYQGDDLLLERHARQIAFRRVRSDCE